MSIILQGINLPKKNMRVICLFPNGAEELVVLDADSGAIAGRPIQAVQIPKGHGRLIIDVWDGSTERGSFEMLMDDAPTILEAEEDK